MTCFWLRFTVSNPPPLEVNKARISFAESLHRLCDTVKMSTFVESCRMHDSPWLWNFINMLATPPLTLRPVAALWGTHGKLYITKSLRCRLLATTSRTVCPTACEVSNREYQCIHRDITVITLVNIYSKSVLLGCLLRFFILPTEFSLLPLRVLLSR